MFICKIYCRWNFDQFPFYKIELLGFEREKLVHSKMLNSIKIQVVALAGVKPSNFCSFYALSQNLIPVSSGVSSFLKSRVSSVLTAA